MRTGIGEVQNNIVAVDEQLADTSAKMADAKIRLPRLYTMATLVSNVLLLLIGAAFVSLFMHSWVLAKNPDLTFQALMLTDAE